MDHMIFIVDDDPFWTAILTQILNELGHKNVKTFSDGQQTIDNLSLNPSLIFLDYQLGTENGLDILQQIKDYNPGIGVLFCTAYEDLSVAISAMEFGSFDYLLKGNVSKGEVYRMLSTHTSEETYTI